MRKVYIVVEEYATRKFNHGIEEVICLYVKVGARIIEHCKMCYLIQMERLHRAL